MLKIGDKVRLMKRMDTNSNWNEIGKGYVRNVFTDKFGIPTFIDYQDKDWPENVVEKVSVNSDLFQVVGN